MSYNFNAMPMKILPEFSVEINKLILKFMWEFKKLRILKIVLKGKNAFVGFILAISITKL